MESLMTFLKDLAMFLAMAGLCGTLVVIGVAFLAFIAGILVLCAGVAYAALSELSTEANIQWASYQKARQKRRQILRDLRLALNKMR